MEKEAKLEPEVKETQPEVKPQEPDKKSRKKLPLIVSIIATALVVGAGLIYWFTRKSSPDIAEQTPQPTVLAEATSLSSSTGSGTPTGTPVATKSPTPTPSPTPAPTPTIQTLTLGATASLDGWRASNNGFNWDYPYIQAGHNSTLTSRGFVSFDITSIPSGATIDQVTLRLYQTNVVGTPYTSSLIVDHVNYGTSQSATPYDGSPIESNIGTLTNNPTIEWKDLVVTNYAKEDISSGRGRAQFAVRFATETTGSDAWAQFTSADGAGNVPQLVIRYH